MGLTLVDIEAPTLTGPIRQPASWLDWLTELFAETPDRFRHLVMVWRRASVLRDLWPSWLEPQMVDRLELAALLHDVGRGLDPDDTQPHGFVGARFLDALGLHDIAPLVAHHSGARFEAAVRGMTDLDRWHVDEPDLLALLTLIDRTTSHAGDRVTLGERRAGLVRHYGGQSRQVQCFDATLPEIRSALALVGRVPSGLAREGSSSRPYPTTCAPAPIRVADKRRTSGSEGAGDLGR